MNIVFDTAIVIGPITVANLSAASIDHAFSGNPGVLGTGPPIKTFGGDGQRNTQFSKELECNDYNLVVA